MYLWRELGVNSWPTFAIVGPNGRLLAQVSGEGRRKVLITILSVCKMLTFNLMDFRLVIGQ